MRFLSDLFPVAALGLLLAQAAIGQQVSLVYDGDATDTEAYGTGSISPETNARRDAIERMGFPVRIENPNNSDSWFDTYGGTLYDVLYIGNEADATALADKIRGHGAPVLSELTAMDDNLGFAVSEGTATAGDWINLQSNALSITSAFPTGALTVYSSSQPIGLLSGSVAAGYTRLATKDGYECLGVVEAGGTLANTIDSNSTAPHRLVRLPFGGAGFDWREVTSDGLELLEQSILWATASTYTPSGALGTCLMLTDEDGTLSDQETFRVRRLQCDGWTVVTLWDGETQTNYDTAVAAADVVYIPATCDATDVADKLRTAACGVVFENRLLDDNFGVSTIDGSVSNTAGVVIEDRDHVITGNFYVGDYRECFEYFRYTNNDWPAEDQPFGRVQGTLATSARVLATRWDDPVLVTLEAGDTLANNVSGNATAAGRRVRLPWTDDSLDFTYLRSWNAGTQIWRQSLVWAAGSASGGLIAHYKLDETSGTTAVDSSGNGYDGEYMGAVTLGVTPAQRVRAANFDVSGDHIYEDANSDFENLSQGDFSIAFWVNPAATSGGTWRNLLHIGGADANDRGPLIMLNPTLERMYCWMSTTAIPTGTGGYSNAHVRNGEWSHVAFVKAGQYGQWYINGEFSNAVTINGEPLATAGQLRIGSSGWWDAPNADLDDVRIYNRAISGDDVAKLHADLVLHYTLDETSGSTATDSSVFKNDGAIVGGPTLGAAGAVDSGYEFDGNGGQYVESGPDEAHELTDMTLAAWVYIPDSIPSGWRTIVEHGRYTNNWYGLWQSATGNTFHFRWGNSGTPYSADSVTTVSADRWYHVAGSYDFTSGVAKLYVNGQLDSQHSSTTSPIPTSSVVRVGAVSSNAEHFKGRIDDVRIYRRVLTDTEIFELGGNGLQLHLAFDESSGTVAADSSPYGNDASTSAGAPGPVAAVVYNGRAFDGVDDVMATDSDFEPPATGAVAFWMRRTTTPTGMERLFGLGGDWEVRQESGGILVFDLGISPYIGYDDFRTNDPVAINGRWLHVVANFNADDDTYEIYLDGELHRSDTHYRDMIAQSAGVLSIGDRTGAGEPYAGELDDLRVYNRELTAKEVAHIYGLIGHWRLDESTGTTTAVDETAYGHDGTYDRTPELDQEGPYPSGVVATAARFNYGDYVIIDNAEHLEVGKDDADFTVAYWLKLNNDHSGSWREIVKKHHNGRERTFGMWLRPSDNRLYPRISTTYSWDEGTNSSTYLDVGRWYHVAYVKQGDKLYLYVDGKLDATDDLLGEVYSNDGDIHLGVRGTTWQHDVSLDDFRIYSRALNQWEVATLHGLVGQWLLDETSGTVATDSSGMKRDGTYLGDMNLGAQAGPTDGVSVAHFDGYDDSVLLPEFYDDFTSGCTLSFWARPTETDARAAFVELSEGNSNHLRVGRKDAGSTLQIELGNTQTVGKIYNNAWRHYVVSADDTGKMTLYIDGALISTSSGALPADVHRTTNAIGSSDKSSSSLFTGQMYDVRVYNRPVSIDEATALYYGETVSGLRIIRWVEVR
ncbi:MAG: LamG domain-containing protein [Planctomycetota bacterium]